MPTYLHGPLALKRQFLPTLPTYLLTYLLTHLQVPLALKRYNQNRVLRAAAVQVIGRSLVSMNQESKYEPRTFMLRILNPNT